jgi:hypothetical protein
LIFSDEFDKLDFENWQHEITMSGGGNWEFQVYENTRENSFTKNGILYIKPTLTSDRFGEELLFSGVLNVDGGSPADACTNPQYWGCERTGAGNNIINPVMSARLRSINSFAFKYGKVDIRAKIPAGDWLWPALWLLPQHNVYGRWPASGEIDIMESRGNRQLFSPEGKNVGVEQVSETLHFGPFFPHNGYEKAHFTKNSVPFDGFDQEFHNYQLEWTPDHISWSIDNVLVGTVVPPAGGFWELGEFPNDIHNPWNADNAENPRMAPFDQKFYIIMNLAVGGSNGFFPDELINQPYPKPWLNTSPNTFLDFWNARASWLPTWQGDDAALQVDYVRVYAI